ncbi:uncharacterized protein GVI51_K11715 [Nakaseomyces glabratus]|uniref:Protein MRH1 n=2 Tax=Candida glabrata TaxID=5478 RepID=Q6FM12_CANGA|nr:uncharacterized protein CAGL0K11880g [Nakaseomyces glabratus]KAH7582509.1 Bacteriorhodopsin-like protein [Nakaseomyces glabratus]KAH7583417.1 Bacteriorhodopsin-like protein [Nakaseomyces glabratus]KAH7584840.1 Bacteriorhodopsin-like protein [Nakaseomyces glabratus]KAH7596441.1 Bacteriorhodopsin-like protein [Nakaseomyces glabratus]KAH7597300.1 Bacteriorhodopsin-like protein [Nakaseomyces glabratus]|eukprot:XP_448732.1 uncharacterized protein CAGL0K11880g [[Candida] glabrata]
MSYVDLYKRGGNEAVKINPPTGADFHITSRGSDWAWAVFCVMFFCAIVMVLLMFRKTANDRLAYYTAIAPCVFMGIAYFTIASNLGWIPVRAKYNHVRTSTQQQHPGVRQIFYARYVGWFMALPWPVIQASLMGKTPIWQIAFNIAMTEVFTVCFLIAACVHSTYKWGYMTIGCGGAIVAMISVMTTTRHLVRAKKDGELWKGFNIYFGLVMFFWAIYPICFGITDGGNVLQPDSALIFYGILDIILYAFLPCLWVPIASYIGISNMGYNFSDAEAGMTTSNTMATVASPAMSPTPKTPKTPKTPATGKKAKKSMA